MITGRLTTNDMGRLEHACSRALVSQPPNLELSLRGVTFADGTARAILARLAERGARIVDGTTLATSF